MAKFIFNVWTNPTPGNEEEFNTWYDNVHVPEVLQVPGFVAAQRFKVSGEASSGESHKYFAIYEVEADSADAAMALLGEHTGSFNMSDALDMNGSKMAWYEPISERVKAS